MIRATTIIYSVMREHNLTPYSYLVCDLIYKYTSSPEGYCNQTLKSIADELSISTRHITRCIAILYEQGLIENIGNKNNPKYRTTSLWFDLVVTDSGGSVLKENYKIVCEDVIEYINHTFNKKYNPSTYYDRFKLILNKTFNGDKVTGELMVEVFKFCKITWSEQYQSSVTPETIFGNKFMTKYLLQYNEWSLNNNTHIKERKNVAII